MDIYENLTKSMNTNGKSVKMDEKQWKFMKSNDKSMKMYENKRTHENA